MVERLPKYAERLFALLCSGAGTLAHKAEEDENGWDYLVEFPKSSHPGPADTHPPGSTAYVQVKSTKTSKKSCRIKLTNALNAAQSRQPWFIVLLRFDKSGNLKNTYAIHFWGRLMHRSLEAVRKAVNNGTPLNQTWLTIKFTDNDQPNDLVVWMQKSIAAVGDDYEAKKKSFYQSVGYEDGYGSGKITVQARTVEEIADGFLGLGDGLSVTQFSFTPARFGIPDPTPQVDLTERRIVVSPDPVGICEIRIRGQGENLSIPGEIFSFSTPDMPDFRKSLRFSTPFFHLIGTKNSTNLRFKLQLDFNKSCDLLTLWRFCTVRRLFAGESVDIQVWVEGNRALAGELVANLGDPNNGWSQLSAFLGVLLKVAGTNDVRLCIADLSKTTREETIFSSVNSDANIQLEFIPLPGAPSNISSVSFYSRARVSDFNFYILSSRAAQDKLVDGRRQITCSKPAIIESYVVKGEPDAGVDLIEGDYNRFLGRQNQIEQSTLGLGNIYAFFNSLSDQQDQSDATES